MLYYYVITWQRYTCPLPVTVIWCVIPIFTCTFSGCFYRHSVLSYSHCSCRNLKCMHIFYVWLSDLCYRPIAHITRSRATIAFCWLCIRRQQPSRCECTVVKSTLISRTCISAGKKMKKVLCVIALHRLADFACLFAVPHCCVCILLCRTLQWFWEYAATWFHCSVTASYWSFVSLFTTHLMFSR